MAESLTRNTQFNFTIQLVAAVAAVVVSVAVARGLGPEAAGIYGYCLWLVALVTALATLGGPNTLTRAVAAHDRDPPTAASIAGRTLRLGALVALGATFVLIVLIEFELLPFAASRPLLRLACAMVPWSALQAYCLAVLAGRRHYDRVLRLQLVLAPVNAGTILAVLWRSGTLTAVLVATALFTLVAALAHAAAAHDLVRWRAGPLPPERQHEMRRTVLTWSGILFLDLVVWQKSEVFFLSLWCPPEAIAYFTIAHSLSTRATMLLPGAISGVLLPQFASLYAGGERLSDVAPTVRRAARYLALVALPLTGAGVVLARPAVLLLYGAAYAPMVPVLQLLVVAGGVGAIAAAASSLLYATGRHGFILASLVIVAALNLLLDVTLIPAYAASGAAAAKGIAQVLASLAGMVYVSRRLHLPFPLFDCGRIALAVTAAAAAVAGLIAWREPSPAAALAMGIPAFALCTALGIWLLRVMHQDDRALLHRLRPRRNRPRA